LSFQFGYELLETTERRKEAQVDPIKFIEAVNITVQVVSNEIIIKVNKPVKDNRMYKIKFKICIQTKDVLVHFFQLFSF
jgi:hypothetical protein